MIGFRFRSLVRSGLALCTALALAACGPLEEGAEADEQVQSHAEAMSPWHYAGNRIDQPRGLRVDPRFHGEMAGRADGEIEQQEFQALPEAPPDQPEDACEARCGADVHCIALCQGALDVGNQQIDEGLLCVDCSRETGFAVGPDLQVRAIGEKTVFLEWTNEGGADHFDVTVRQYSHTSGQLEAEMVWSGIKRTSLRLDLESGYRFGFQVTAYSETDEVLGTSEVVHADL